MLVKIEADFNHKGVEYRGNGSVTHIDDKLARELFKTYGELYVRLFEEKVKADPKPTSKPEAKAKAKAKTKG